MTREAIAQGRRELTSSSSSAANKDDWAMMDNADEQGTQSRSKARNGCVVRLSIR
jgi:hypothetical protein